MCVIALGLDTWDAPVKEVGLYFCFILSTQLFGSTPFFLLGIISICVCEMLTMLLSGTFIPQDALSSEVSEV